MKKLLLFIELLVIFVGLPSLFLIFENLSPLPILLFITIGAILILWYDQKFKKKLLWNARVFSKFRKAVFVRSLVVLLLLSGLAYLIVPEFFYGFPRFLPWIWILVMLLYPILSAYPQEIVYRTFFFQRYRLLFPKNESMIIASTVLFSFSHIVYQNLIAIVLSLIGGYVLSRTYVKSKSTFVVSIEHAIYGCIVFTVGLGMFFYNG